MGEGKRSISLMLMVTLGCNSECSHCCFACDQQKLALRLTEREMIYYIEQVYSSNYNVDSVIFSGGEATLYAKSIYLPMTIAHHFGLHIDLRTNAHWAKSEEVACSVLQEYQDRGLQQLGLSYDNYHNAIPVENIRNALQAARKLGIKTYLDWIGLESYEWVLEYLQIERCELRAVIPPLRIGRAKELSDEHFKYQSLDSFRDSPSCKDTNALLTIFPGGYASLHPCCWVNPALIRKIGNNGWLKKLDKEMKNSPMVNYISNYGIGGLIQKAEQEQPHLLKREYSYQCEACYDLLGKLFPEEVEEMPWYLKELESV